jgi:drug/metabolite transporter (DMT)-like permease
MSKASRYVSGFLFVLLAGTGFGFIGVFSRYCFRNGLSVGEVVTWRFVLAAILLWISLLLLKSSLIRLSIGQIFLSLALGAFGYAVFSTFYFKAIDGLSVPLAVLLLYTFPILVNLGAHFFLRQTMNRGQILSLLLAFGGLTILLWGPIEVHKMSAVLFGLGSAAFYAIYVLVSGELQRAVPPLSSTLYVITATAVTLMLFHQPQLSHLFSKPAIVWWSLIGLATVSTMMPLTLFLAGLQRIPSGQASIVSMVEPVVATIAAGFFLGEHLSSHQMMGAVLILAALVINALAKSRLT